MRRGAIYAIYTINKSFKTAIQEKYHFFLFLFKKNQNFQALFSMQNLPHETIYVPLITLFYFTFYYFLYLLETCIIVMHAPNGFLKPFYKEH